MQRNRAGFRDPRIVACNSTGSICMGFAPRANQVEIISLNPATGSSDFLVYENFTAPATRRLVTANRQLCMSCHQSGGPIFSRGGWGESTVSGPFETSRGVPYRDETGAIYQGNQLYQAILR